MGASDPNAEAKPAPGSGPNSRALGAREARLAKALRDNLRRRKAGRSGGESGGDDEAGTR